MPGKGRTAGIEDIGFAAVDTGATKRAALLIEANLWIAAATAMQDTFGAGINAGIAARTAIGEVVAGPRRALDWAVASQGAEETATVTGIACCMAHGIPDQLGGPGGPVTICIIHTMKP